MSENRKTEIVEEEIEDLGEEIASKRDEVCEQFKLALLNEDPTRILV